ncbi:uncharacterized protein LOC101901423 [Musca domestica]|uniref:Uncharacterized protein LOC101901423 n=1 Tax=Musca domestica TaxID=7370 RepID=A0A1I8NBF7_MUSDO|nr:uncharacterized protein LOC101901423 [Musca domestica]XP_058984378.1 uncharacterized protein LOC101901423 [Musca domestica]
MQRIKAAINNRLQLDSKWQQLKELPKSPAFQGTAAVLVAVGLLTWLHIRPLGLFFLFIFGFWFYKTRLNIRIQTPPELKKHLQQIEQRLLEWRQNRPVMFSAVASGALGALAVVGHLVTGSMAVLAGLVVAVVISSKYNFKIMKIEPSELTDWTEKVYPETEMDDEFMPEVNETNLFLLERASDLASLTSPTEDLENDEDKSDEVPSELLIPDSIPEIDENSTDEEQDDLMPIIKSSQLREETPVPSSSTTATTVKYSQSGDAIEFKKGHFKRDSSLSTTSSSSEESLSKGLQFPDHTTVVDSARKSQSTAAATAGHNQEVNDVVALAVKAQTQALFSNGSKLIPTIVSGLVQNVLGTSGTAGGPMIIPPKRVLSTNLESSDESDFEILEDEDFQ